MKRATKAAPRIRRSPAAAADALEQGTRRAATTHGYGVVVGLLAHELQREEVVAAYRGRILEDPIPLLSTSEQLVADFHDRREQ